jgi:hypothetical protein
MGAVGQGKRRHAMNDQGITSGKCEDSAIRHRVLHDHLDELIACWINVTGKRPSQATILDLMQWSAEMTRKKETASP